MYRKFLLSFFSLAVVSMSASAQTNESSDLDDLIELDETPTAVSSTFKGTRVVNGHSIENTARGILDFRISHRFGRIDGGLGDFFGLDGANTMLTLDYGVTDKLAVGLSRSGFQKEIEGYGKYKLLTQKTSGMPISLSYLGVMSVTTMSAPTYAAGNDYPFSNRLFYVNQLIIARKFNKTFSFQLSPTHIHYNFVEATADPNDLLVLGAAASVKVSKRIALNAEYFFRVPGQRFDDYGYTNAFSLGCDIETGGHVFQLLLTNSNSMTQRYMMTQTIDKWLDGIHFGFNISRVFTVVKPMGTEGLRNNIY